MNSLHFEYFVIDKGLPPQPIRMKLPGWGGLLEQKMENGSEPQPWHCKPFVDASTYGLELVYPYETECQVVNEDGNVRFEWDYASEPGIKLDGLSFGVFDNRPARYYLFQASVDIQAPPGYVMQTQPHPRFFTDPTGTVPAALISHVQSEWWPRPMFAVFKVPLPGQRHIFRKGEPYVQILFVPQQQVYEGSPMGDDHAQRRRELREKISSHASYIATNVWHEPFGGEMRNYYKRLARSFEESGLAGVEELANDAAARRAQAVPEGKSVEEYLELARQYEHEGKQVQAKDIYTSLLMQDPSNAEAGSRLGILAASMGLPEFAKRLLEQAIAVNPREPAYRANLGEVLRSQGQLQRAETALRGALELSPLDPLILTTLAITLAAQQRFEEALQLCRGATQSGTRLPIVYFRTGAIFAEVGQIAQARACFQTVLSLDPGNEQAQMRLESLSQEPPRP